MKSLIIYGCQTKLTKAHKPVHWVQTESKLCPQPKYFVRVKTFNGDCVDALDKAKPMPGETVLNTVDIL